jgi:hypothetical protein
LAATFAKIYKNRMAVAIREVSTSRLAATFAKIYKNSMAVAIPEVVLASLVKSRCSVHET